MGAVSKTFKSGNSVAVRLPRELGIPVNVELEIEKAGAGWLLRRKSKLTGRDLVEALAKLPKPKTKMKRVGIEFPERRWGSAKAR